MGDCCTCLIAWYRGTLRCNDVQREALSMEEDVEWTRNIPNGDELIQLG